MTTTSSTVHNDVNLGAVGELTSSIIDDGDRAATTWQASVDWKGGFQSAALIREFDPIA